MKDLKTLALFHSMCILFWITPISFTGYYTDIFLFFCVAIYTSFFLLKQSIPENRGVLLLFPKLLLSFILFAELYIAFSYFTGLDKKKIENVTRFTINNSERQWTYINAYFNYKSIGCGTGEYWEAVTLKYLPLFEYKISHNECTDFVVEEEYEPQYLP